ncbi:hypothetical protein PCASD_01562 [Puccinia coronata f. sp. avenae]|uniref:Uncharacterized protein n=1 Tax=Puccinia coronata f. sp. avenae TaxID=200324 RepID=A0A2N5VIC9_9BASI|nr:hypothetical protein PCASD_06556 [Puccinia coronata f. sp. avenae]PLW49742.1 hypothetical protein PCASD_01562 [Puccinia coronata f. sp. avenae]
MRFFVLVILSASVYIAQAALPQRTFDAASTNTTASNTTSLAANDTGVSVSLADNKTIALAANDTGAAVSLADNKTTAAVSLGSDTAPAQIPLECARTFVPVSQLDLYELMQQADNSSTSMNSTTMMQQADNSTTSMNSTTTAPLNKTEIAQLSQEKTMAICETGTQVSAGLCSLKTCGMSQTTVCTQCTEVSPDSSTVTPASGATPVDEVSCDGGYVMQTPQNQQKGNMCMTKDKVYTCSGECQGGMACQQCVADDSASTTPHA